MRGAPGLPGAPGLGAPGLFGAPGLAAPGLFGAPVLAAPGLVGVCLCGGLFGEDAVGRLEVEVDPSEFSLREIF